MVSSRSTSDNFLYFSCSFGTAYSFDLFSFKGLVMKASLLAGNQILYAAAVAAAAFFCLLPTFMFVHLIADILSFPFLFSLWGFQFFELGYLHLIHTLYSNEKTLFLLLITFPLSSHFHHFQSCSCFVTHAVSTPRKHAA